jgi:phenylacetate-CoA ligase
MISLRAIRAGASATVKRVAGLRYRSINERAWEFSRDEHERYQIETFREVYSRLVTRVPYYRDRPKDYPPGAQTSWRNLSEIDVLPILTKSDVRSANREFWADPLPRLTTFHTTSGTSGTPLKIPASLAERGRVEDALSVWYGRLTGKTWPRMLVLSGFFAPTDGRREAVALDPLFRMAFVSIYELSRTRAAEVADFVSHFEPDVVYGYASAVHGLAQLLDRQRIAPSGTRVAITTSEVLYPEWRPVIERSLGLSVHGLYGSQEGCHVATECVEGAYHVNPLFGIVEVLDEDGRPCAPGEMGRVVVTSLSHESMPLVRYDIGDTARLPRDRSPCACGTAWPRLGEILGRSEDLVRTPDGRRVGYLCFHATKDLEGIEEAQLIQRDFSRFRMLAVLESGADSRADEISRAVQREVERRLSYPVEFEFARVDRIPRGPNGKFKAVVVEEF